MKAKKMEKKKAVRKKVTHKTEKNAKKPAHARPKQKKVAKPVHKVTKSVKKTAVKSKKTEMPEKKMQKTQKRESKEDINYVEVKVKCTECFKEVKIVTLDGSDNSEYLCQKCSTGDFLEDDDDF